MMLNEIINWLEEKPLFWKEIVNLFIKNKELTETDIKNIVELCKNSNDNNCLEELKDNTDSYIYELRELADNFANTESIILHKINNIKNINALSINNELIFSQKGLNVIYGDNGSGKSSYVSILKHVCNTRGPKPRINRNLYASEAKTMEQTADVVYIVNKKEFNTVHLKDGIVSNNTLKKIDIFDTYSSNDYIQNKDKIAFIPQGLILIENLAKAIKKVEEKLKSELNKLQSEKFQYENLQIPNDTEAKKFLVQLTAQTNLKIIESKFIWNNEKEEKLICLEKKIADLKGTDPKKIINNNIAKINRYEIIVHKFQKYENFFNIQSVNKYKKICNEYCNNKEALKEASDNAFSDLPIKGVGNNAWKALWESARKFYNMSADSEDFPDMLADSYCPLCLQKLDKDAKIRLNKFEEFVKKDIQTSFDASKKEYERVVQKLTELDMDFKEQEPIINELNKEIDNYLDIHNNYLEQLIQQKEYLVNLFYKKKTVENIELMEECISPKISINELISSLKKENEKYKENSLDAEMQKLEQEKNELIGEKKISKYTTEIKSEIQRLKRIELLNKCINECRTNSITNLSNKLTKSYITDKIKKNFHNELQKLNFYNINIESETEGKVGKQYHYLKLKEDNSENIALKDILSEGEQRCISLATFLSEVAISEHKSAIVFDDPVSSLDHKWRKRIAERIADEARVRQVIVFTHDITFLLMLEESSTKKGCPIEVKGLTRKRTETGIVATNPPWDTLSVKKRIAILNDKLCKLKKVSEEETEEEYSEQVRMFYGKLRETWERFIEEIVLNKVIVRFRREIQTQRLKVISDLTEEDYQKIEENMKKCSTYMNGHDTSGALLEVVPDYEELRNDIKVLTEYQKEMRKRKRS